MTVAALSGTDAAIISLAAATLAVSLLAFVWSVYARRSDKRRETAYLFVERGPVDRLDDRAFYPMWIVNKGRSTAHRIRIVWRDGDGNDLERERPLDPLAPGERAALNFHAPPPPFEAHLLAKWADDAGTHDYEELVGYSSTTLR
jgi:hypothetical protein